MPTTAEEIYNQIIKSLPPSERLRLATMILNDISPRAVVDYSEEWTEEDLRDFTAATWSYAARSLGEEDGNVSSG
jgi:hypothetical protein